MSLRVFVSFEMHINDQIKTHGSESQGQERSTSLQTHLSILQEQTLLK